MNKESLIRLGLDHILNIDAQSSLEHYDPHTNNHTILLKLIKDALIICPHCGMINSYRIRGSSTQSINHSSSLEDNIKIKLSRRVFLCECGKTFKERNPFTDTKEKMTFEKKLKILHSLKNINKSMKDIASDFQTSTTTVTNIFDNYVDLSRGGLTEVLCVDEVYSKHTTYKHYCFIIYSPQQNKILDILPSRRKLDVINYFSLIPLKERLKVKFFSMDLYEPYRQIAKSCFPNCLICADHFHVIKNLTDDFNNARKRIMRKYEHLKTRNDNWYWIYKIYWKLLLKNPDKLGYKKFKIQRSRMYLDEHQLVEYMLSIDNELKDAYDLLNDYKIYNSTATITDAENRLDELILRFYNSSLPEYLKFYKLLKNWKNEIINSFNKINGYIISNGGLERTNRDIKTILRHAYGYRNFQRLKNRIMYIKNKDATILAIPKSKK